MRIIESRQVCLAALAVLQLASVACGGEGAEPAGAPAEGDSIEIEQAFGESTCGSTAPDVTRAGPVTREGATTYNHSSCTDSFILQVNSVNSAYRAYAAYAAPVAGPCDAMWANMSLWKLVGSTYSKVVDAPIQVGQLYPGTNSCLRPSTEFQIPSSGRYKIIGQAGWTIIHQAVLVGTYKGETRNMSQGDDRGFVGNGDWAQNHFKGECRPGRSVLGVSRMPSGTSGVRNVYCAEIGLPAGTGSTTLDFTNGDDRRSTTSGDWDVNFTKGECPTGQIITGLAQTSSGVINKAVCGSSGFARASGCRKLDFSTGDARTSLDGGDWSFGDFKGQCDGTAKMTGISKDHAGHPKAVLCCDMTSP